MQNLINKLYCNEKINNNLDFIYIHITNTLANLVLPDLASFICSTSFTH